MRKKGKAHTLAWAGAVLFAALFAVLLGGCQAGKGEVGWVVMERYLGSVPVSINGPEEVRALREHFRGLEYRPISPAGMATPWPRANVRLTWFDRQGRLLEDFTVLDDGTVSCGDALYELVDGRLAFDWALLSDLGTQYAGQNDMTARLEILHRANQVGVCLCDEEDLAFLRAAELQHPDLAHQVNRLFYSHRYEETEGRLKPYHYIVSWTERAEDGSSRGRGGLLYVIDESHVSDGSKLYRVTNGKLDLGFLDRLLDPNGPYAGKEDVEFWTPEPPSPPDPVGETLLAVESGGYDAYDAQNPHGPYAQLWLPYDPDQVAWALLNGGDAYEGKTVAVTQGKHLQYLQSALGDELFWREGYYHPWREAPKGGMTLTLYGSAGEELAVLSVNEKRSAYGGYWQSGPPATPAELSLGLWHCLLTDLPPVE